MGEPGRQRRGGGRVGQGLCSVFGAGEGGLEAIGGLFLSLDRKTITDADGNMSYAEVTLEKASPRSFRPMKTHSAEEGTSGTTGILAG